MSFPPVLSFPVVFCLLCSAFNNCIVFFVIVFIFYLFRSSFVYSARRLSIPVVIFQFLFSLFSSSFVYSAHRLSIPLVFFYFARLLSVPVVFCLFRSCFVYSARLLFLVVSYLLCVFARVHLLSRSSCAPLDTVRPEGCQWRAWPRSDVD